VVVERTTPTGSQVEVLDRVSTTGHRHRRLVPYSRSWASMSSRAKRMWSSPPSRRYLDSSEALALAALHHQLHGRRR